MRTAPRARAAATTTTTKVRGNVDGVPFDNRVDLSGRTHTWSVYATDTVSVNDILHLTLSGRYNRTKLANSDQINPGHTGGL